MHTLDSLEQFKQLLTMNWEFILYKHSPICNISDKACHQVSQTIDELKYDNIYMLDVLNSWNLKFDIANYIKVKHESPQVLIFRDGKLITHASHLTISSGRLKQHLLGRNDTRK
jgi:bacillithiol system protein YtxJ